MSRPRDYGEMMANAAGDGFDSPEDAARARREARREAYFYEDDLDQPFPATPAEKQPDTQPKSHEADKGI